MKSLNVPMGQIIILGMLLFLLIPITLNAQVTSTEVQKLTANDGASFYAFGRDVAVHGKVALITADVDKDQGAAYFYRWDGSKWVVEQKVIAKDIDKGDRFGVSAAMRSPDMALIGKPGPFVFI